MIMSTSKRKTRAGRLACSEEIESAEKFGRENQVQYGLKDTMIIMMMIMIKETVKK